jgi:hypothetical protein
MNPFTEHTQQQGVGYVEHACFALGIALRLLRSVVAFAVHAVFPFIGIERRLDLEATADFLRQRNAWIEGAAARSVGRSIHRPGSTEARSDPFLHAAEIALPVASTSGRTTFIPRVPKDELSAQAVSARFALSGCSDQLGRVRSGGPGSEAA